MSDIAKQVHNKFKVFVGELAPDGTVGKLADEVAAFANRAKVAAKSIGVEYLESVKRLVITLGYRDDEGSYPIQLHCVPLGKVDALAGNFVALEDAMAEASGKYPNIICHELYGTEKQDFMLVLMTHQS